MKTNRLKSKSAIQVLLVSTLMIFFACSKDEVGNTDDDPVIATEESDDFNTAIAKLNSFSQPDESSIIETASSEPEKEGETALECYTQTFKGAPGFNELFTLDPTTDVIYPGAMLKGESIPTGEYSRVNADRAPITMSISLSNISGSPSVTINNPNNLSEVRQGINELLSREVTGATPAQLVVEESEVYSEQQLAIALGANYRDRTKDISGNFDFNSTTVKKKYVLKFIQRYFTLDLDSPGKMPSDLFTSLPSIESLGATNPVYVSSVTYGRMVLYTVETESSISEIKTAFDAAIEAGQREGEFELDTDSKKILEKSSIKALIIGGSWASAAQTIGGDSLSKIYDFIAEGGNYTQDSPGAPLAYKLSYVKEGFPAARVVLATEYQVRNCDLAYPEFDAVISKITGTQISNTEVNGKLRVKMWVGGERLDYNNNGIDDGKTWSTNTDNYVDVQNDNTHTIDESYTFKPYRPNMATDYVECSGELFDYNGFILGNESLGNAGGVNKVFLNTLKIDESVTVKLDFKKGITAHFIITRTK